MIKRDKIKQLFANDRGAVMVETALIATVLGTIGLGVLDFGLAFTRNMQLANAARAGMQYALVRRPVDEDYSAIVNAVNTAAPSLTADSGRQVNTTLYCECPDGTASDCVGEGGEDLTCDDGNMRAAYLDISITETHTLLFSYPGIDDTLTLSQTATLRLN